MADSSATASEPKASTGRGFVDMEEVGRVWRGLPDKWIFGVLLGAWMLVFYFLGHPSLGHREVRTPNLYHWMHYAYTNPGSEDGHALLIPLAVLGFLWWKREELLACPKSSWVWGLVGLGGAGAIHLMGIIVQQPRISIIALFAGIYSLVALVWGWRLALKCAFPFILFAYCVPVGTLVDTVTFPLRKVATDVSVWVSQYFFGIEVIKDGVRIFDAAGTYQYEVAAACSGLRSLIAMSALMTCYAFMNFRKPWKQWVVVFSAIPVAIAGNIVRLLAIILATTSISNEAGHLVHEWFGFVTFLLAIAFVLLLGRWIGEDVLPASDAGEGGLSHAA